MAEPVGLLGTVVGVVSLGLQVHGSLKEYLDAFKSRDKRVDQALKRLELLQQSLKFINSIVPSLGAEHREPADAVMSSLLEVQADLQALRDKLQENKPLDPTNLIEKVKEKKKKLAFPFRISDLDKLDSTLENIVMNLSIAMQGLGLNMSSVIDTKVSPMSPQLDTLTAISRDIQATQATDAIRQIDAQSALNSGLQAIECSTSHIEDQVSRLTPNMESVLDEVLKIGQTINLVLKNQSSSPDSETLHRIAASMMIAKPALLSTASDAVNSNSTALSGLAKIYPQEDVPQDSALEANRKSKTSCNCRHRRRVSLKSSNWFLFSTFEELVTESRHKPWCRLFQPVNLVNHRRFGVVIAGLHRYLSTAVSLSLCMSRGAGGGSLSPTIRYFGMVDRKKSQPFLIVDALMDIIRFKNEKVTWTSLLEYELLEKGLIDTDIMDSSSLHVSSFEEILQIGISTLRRTYGSGAALPTDVDEDGNTAVKSLCESGILTILKPIRRMEGLNELYDLLRALLDLGIPCTTPAELTTKSIVDICLQVDVSTPFSRRALSFISEDIVANLLLRETSGDLTGNKVDLVSYRDSIAKSEPLAEVLDLDSPIYTALLRRNEDDLRRLLQDLPMSSLVEKTNGPTFAHLAIGWAAGLKILLDVTPRLEINSEYYGESPFILAMRHSRSACEGRNMKNCISCTCAKSAKILLEARCHLSYRNIYRLNRYHKHSLRAFFSVLEHIKIWRDKLKSLLFEHMPEMKLSGMYDSSVLDFKAGEVIANLERRGTFPFQKYDLQPNDYRLRSRFGLTVYHSITDHRLAGKAFELGFRDVDADCNGQTPLMATMGRNERWTRKPYVSWLITHGANYTRLAPYKATGVNIDILPKRTVSHVLLGQLAFETCCDLRGKRDPGVPSLDNLRLLSKASIGDGCECGCSRSSDGCYPITIFQRVFFREYMSHYTDSQDKHSYYQNGVMWICEKLFNLIVKKDKVDITIKAILRGFTFEYLVHHSPTPTEFGLRHTCCKGLYIYFFIRCEEPTRDDLENYARNHGNVQKNDHSLLRKLDELVAEFTEQFSHVASSFSEFIQDYWFPRMKEVIDELERSYLSQDEATEEEDDDDSNEDSDFDVD